MTNLNFNHQGGVYRVQVDLGAVSLEDLDRGRGVAHGIVTSGTDGYALQWREIPRPRTFKAVEDLANQVFQDWVRTVGGVK